MINVCNIILASLPAVVDGRSKALPQIQVERMPLVPGLNQGKV